MTGYLRSIVIYCRRMSEIRSVDYGAYKRIELHQISVAGRLRQLAYFGVCCSPNVNSDKLACDTMQTSTAHSLVWLPTALYKTPES